MTVRRSGNADFSCRSADLAAHVRAVLANPMYRRTQELEPDRLFETIVQTSELLLETRLKIRLEAHAESTLATCEIVSQWFLFGDVGNYYPRYIQEFLDALRREVAGLGTPPLA